jgi:hypothetical protein
MEIKGNGLTVQVDAAEQTDQWLIEAATEIREAAEARGLEVPAFTGLVAVEGANNDIDVDTATETARDVKVDPADVKESLLGQLDTAFSGYKTVVEHINGGRSREEQVEVADQETVETELKTWLTDEKAEYMARTQEADPELRWTLIASPNNVEVTPEEAEELAVEFGKNQPYLTYPLSPILKRYTPAELSGTDPSNGNKIRFAAVPSKLTPELYGTVAAQRDALAELQADMPDVRLSSHLDDLVYWYTLRAQGDDLAHGDVYERTNNSHFDLPEQRLDGDDFVLDSCVNVIGEPSINAQSVRFAYYGRALVG